MGKMIEEAAKKRGHEIAAVIDPYICTTGDVKSADVIIEFTKSDTAVENIKAAAALGKPIVVGTTGWHERLGEAAAIVEKGGASLLWSSNFSLGVNLFYRIAERAAQLIDPFAEYDVAGYEVHHNKKADSPSGTAKTLVEKVLAVMKRKKKALWERSEGSIDSETLHYVSLRVGAVPGVHSLVFDSPADTIELTHTARNREGFASGALIAAEWLVNSGPAKAAGVMRRGVFTMDDVLKDILP
jgi:4-hydroxy-tetrahydrodipicolinate reductase